MTIAIGDDVIDVLVHGPNRYFDNYRTDSVHEVRLVYPFGYCGGFPPTWLNGVSRAGTRSSSASTAPPAEGSRLTVRMQPVGRAASH